MSFFLFFISFLFFQIMLFFFLCFFSSFIVCKNVDSFPPDTLGQLLLIKATLSDVIASVIKVISGL